MTDQLPASLVELTAQDFLDKLAARTPTPGGGAVAGLAGALSCSLARMVAAYSLGKKTADADRSAIENLTGILERADAMMRELIDEDAQAYATYSEISRRKDSDEATRRAKDEALVMAMTVPLGISATAAEAVAALEQLAPIAGKYLLSDLEAAAILAEATVRCAGCSVRVNARIDPNSDRADRVIDQLTQIEAHAQQRLEAVVRILADRIQSGE